MGLSIILFRVWDDHFPWEDGHETQPCEWTPLPRASTSSAGGNAHVEWGPWGGVWSGGIGNSRTLPRNWESLRDSQKVEGDQPFFFWCELRRLRSWTQQLNHIFSDPEGPEIFCKVIGMGVGGPQMVEFDFTQCIWKTHIPYTYGLVWKWDSLNSGVSSFCPIFLTHMVSTDDSAVIPLGPGTTGG